MSSEDIAMVVIALISLAVYILIVLWCRRIAIQKNRDPVFWTGLAILLNGLILIILLFMSYRPKLETDIRKIQSKK